MSLTEEDWMVRIGLIWHRIGTNSREHGNEPSCC